MSVKVGVVILNYSSYQATIELVEKLQEQSVAADMFVVVVDNSSPNESFLRLKTLEDLFDNVVVIETDDNLGYARGNNFGLRYLDEMVGVDYVAILNNDVILPSDSFEQLIARYEILERPAIIAPLMCDPNGKISLPWPLNTYSEDIVSLFALTRLWFKPRPLDNLQPNQAIRVDTIPGSYIFARMATFKQMGYFYPNTFLYAEERFLSYAAQQLGLQNYLLLDQRYIHAHNSPTISHYHDNLSKHRMLYESWLEFTRVCRPNGALKAAILTPMVSYSLLEWRVIGWVKNMMHR